MSHSRSEELVAVSENALRSCLAMKLVVARGRLSL